MRRKPGAIVPLELDILEASVTLRARGLAEVHGFLLARTIGDATDAKRLTAYGTLYKALDRLERAGYLESRWEEPAGRRGSVAAPSALLSDHGRRGSGPGRCPATRSRASPRRPAPSGAPVT